MKSQWNPKAAGRLSELNQEDIFPPKNCWLFCLLTAVWYYNFKNLLYFFISPDRRNDSISYCIWRISLYSWDDWYLWFYWGRCGQCCKSMSTTTSSIFNSQDILLMSCNIDFFWISQKQQLLSCHFTYNQFSLGIFWKFTFLWFINSINLDIPWAIIALLTHKL